MVGFGYYGMNAFCFALIAGQATSFVLKQKKAKIQDDNDPSALRGQHLARRSRRANASFRIIDRSGQLRTLMGMGHLVG